jgi:hypothetical protein
MRADHEHTNASADNGTGGGQFECDFCARQGRAIMDMAKLLAVARKVLTDVLTEWVRSLKGSRRMPAPWPAASR